MPTELMRRCGRLCLDEDSLPERIALLEEHATAVERQLAELHSQRERLAGKLDWYREELNRRKAG